MHRLHGFDSCKYNSAAQTTIWALLVLILPTGVPTRPTGILTYYSQKHSILAMQLLQMELFAQFMFAMGQVTKQTQISSCVPSTALITALPKGR